MERSAEEARTRRRHAVGRDVIAKQRADTRKAKKRRKRKKRKRERPHASKRVEAHASSRRISPQGEQAREAHLPEPHTPPGRSGGTDATNDNSDEELRGLGLPTHALSLSPLDPSGVEADDSVEAIRMADERVAAREALLAQATGGNGDVPASGYERFDYFGPGRSEKSVIDVDSDGEDIVYEPITDYYGELAPNDWRYRFPAYVRAERGR